MIVNISEKNRAFIWTPQRTASTLSSMIFNHFDFYAYDIKKKEKVSDTYKHFHTNCFFEGHEKLDFILTCRNPYVQFLSLMGYNKQSYEEVKSFSSVFFHEKSHHLTLMRNLLKRKPTYIIRVENIVDDYLKIPFIRESDFNTSGKLIETINSKPNSSNFFKSMELLDLDLADLIYYNNIPIFELCGYEKDSWKLLKQQTQTSEFI